MDNQGGIRQQSMKQPTRPAGSASTSAGQSSGVRLSAPARPLSSSTPQMGSVGLRASGMPGIRGGSAPGPGQQAGPSCSASTSAGTTSASTSSRPAISISGNAVLVNKRQMGNPLLQGIRNVPWEYADIVPDYVMGAHTCALFLSLKYHNLNPEYIHERLKQLGRAYNQRILLVLIDVKDPHHPLKELAKMTIIVDITLIPAWSSEEAGRYIELYKTYENKPADMIQAHGDGDYLTKLTDALTTVKSVNKTDAKTLVGNFRTFQGITEASPEDLSLLHGIGLQKAKRLHDVLHQPFLRDKRSALNNVPGPSDHSTLP
ncbi:DNA excision repair protein ERCC-1 [Hypsibius exemplaris]|uniref:DNA excision repair protein ERCC-1 n=1 Tax=Hypsibius exemplaris TaxID=2072580 RepID=A0A1W0X1B1_HYPEX|nr:DNA excision repair protein ERCC-1 [Hypsibius exemplaris]